MLLALLQVHPDWAPLGAARFQEMLDDSFFKGIRFFRVIDGFMAQFGIHGKPSKAAGTTKRHVTSVCAPTTAPCAGRHLLHEADNFSVGVTQGSLLMM